MKKILCIILLIINMVSMCGCANGAPNDVEEGETLALEVLRCLDEEDIENLKNLFCAEVQDTHNLDKEIEEALVFLEGTSVEYRTIMVSSGESDRDWEIVKFNVVPVIRDVKTDGQKNIILQYIHI